MKRKFVLLWESGGRLGTGGELATDEAESSCVTRHERQTSVTHPVQNLRVVRHVTVDGFIAARHSVDVRVGRVLLRLRCHGGARTCCDDVIVVFVERVGRFGARVGVLHSRRLLVLKVFYCSHSSQNSKRMDIPR